MNVHQLKPYKVTKTKFSGMLEYMQKQNGAMVITLNTFAGDRFLTSQTVVFAHIENDFEREDVKIISNQHQIIFISNDAMDRFVLNDVKQTANGYDHQFIFHCYL